jgi:hypothetical protein
MQIRYPCRAGALVVLIALCACGGALQSQDLRFAVADTKFLIRDTGAIIAGKRQVAKLESESKLLDSRGRVLAWLHEDSMRLRGGVTLPIRKDSDGTVYVPVSAQEQAGLKPVAYRVRPNGTMAQTEGAQGVPITGRMSPDRQRLVLLVLILSQNNRWD